MVIMCAYTRECITAREEGRYRDEEKVRDIQGKMERRREGGTNSLKRLRPMKCGQKPADRKMLLQFNLH